MAQAYADEVARTDEVMQVARPGESFVEVPVPLWKKRHAERLALRTVEDAAREYMAAGIAESFGRECVAYDALTEALAVLDKARGESQ